LLLDRFAKEEVKFLQNEAVKLVSRIAESDSTPFLEVKKIINLHCKGEIEHE